MIEESGMYWENFINGNDEDDEYEGGRGHKSGKEKREPVNVPDWLHIVLYSIFFAGAFLLFAESVNARFQIMEKVYVCFGLAFFALILWVMQKVKLFNWQSLLLTIAFGVYAYFYIKIDGQGGENRLLVFSELSYRYLIMILLADIAITRRIRTNQKFIPWAFALLCVTSVLTFVNNGSALAPLVNVFVIAACFLPVGAKEWNKVTEGMFFGGLIAFIIFTIFSYVGDPLIIERGDYYYSRPDVASFLGLALVLAVFGLIFFKEKHGRFSFPYNLSIAWIIGIAVLAYAKNAFGFLPGIVLAGMLLIIFGVKKYDAKSVLIRVAIAIGACVLVAAGTFVYIRFLTPNPPSSFGGVVKNATGNRIELWDSVKIMMNWYTHPISPDGDGIYFLNMRMQYLSYLYEYGIIIGVLNILLMLVMGVTSIIQYVKTGRSRFLLAMIAIFMLLGVWFNANTGMTAPLGFAALLSIYPLVVDVKGGKKRVKKSKAEAGEESSGDETEEEAKAETKKHKKKKAEEPAEPAESVEEGVEGESVQDAGEEKESKVMIEPETFEEKAPEEVTDIPAEEAVETTAEATVENATNDKEHITKEEAARIDAQINTGVIDLGNTGPMLGRPMDRSSLEDEVIMDFEVIHPGEGKAEE